MSYISDDSTCLTNIAQRIARYEYAADEVPYDSYGSLGRSFLATFIMLTSENWPTVALGPYKSSAWNGLYFITSVTLLSMNRVTLSATHRSGL